MAEEQSYTDLLKEIATLQQRLEHYEANVLPVYNEHIAGYKASKLQEYGLTDTFWIEKVTGADKAEIDEQVQALAVDLRIVQRNQPVDPQGMGNGYRSKPKQTDLKAEGAKVYHKVKGNGRLNKYVSSIKAESAPPVKAPISESKKGIIARWLGR